MHIDFEELLFGVPRRLAHTYRYATVPTVYKETVDAHSFHTCYYSFLIALYAETVKNVHIDWRFMALAGSNHDLDESLTGDLLRDVKRSSPELHQLWNTMCEKVVTETSVKLIGSNDLAYYWKNDKDLTRIEGMIISLSDFLSVLSYTHEEISRGNKLVAELNNNCRNYIYNGFSKVLEDIGHPLFDITYCLFKVIGTKFHDERFSKLLQDCKYEAIQSYLMNSDGKLVPHNWYYFHMHELLDIVETEYSVQSRSNTVVKPSYYFRYTDFSNRSQRYLNINLIDERWKHIEKPTHILLTNNPWSVKLYSESMNHEQHVGYLSGGAMIVFEKTFTDIYR